MGCSCLPSQWPVYPRPEHRRNPRLLRPYAAPVRTYLSAPLVGLPTLVAGAAVVAAGLAVDAALPVEWEGDVLPRTDGNFDWPVHV